MDQATKQKISKRLASLEPKQRAELVELLQAHERLLPQRLFYELYTDTGRRWTGPPIQKGLIETGQFLHPRHLYPKHMEFFRAGAHFPERLAMCGNRIGKTFGMGGYETSAHLTGEYPKWWEGRKFDNAVSAWAAGKTFETTRDIMQLTLLGQVTKTGARKGVDGRGVIPGHLIIQDSITWKSGVPDLIDNVKIRHVSGDPSDLGFKSYDQGRGSFEGTGKHVIWMDEEPPISVYDEALIRTATVDGIVYITFTPLNGLTQVVMQFLPSDQHVRLDEV